MEQQEGEEGSQGMGHLVIFFLFFFFDSLNKCHFFEAKEGTVNILDNFFSG